MVGHAVARLGTSGLASEDLRYETFATLDKSSSAIGQTEEEGSR